MKNLQEIFGFIGIKVIRMWVKLFGKSVLIKDNSWLKGPIGPNGKIADKPYEIIAEKENLTIENDPKDALIKDFDILDSPNFDVEKCDPKVRHFYENTAQYELDVWSETRFPDRSIFMANRVNS